MSFTGHNSWGFSHSRMPLALSSYSLVCGGLQYTFGENETQDYKVNGISNRTFRESTRSWTRKSLLSSLSVLFT